MGKQQKHKKKQDIIKEQSKSKSISISSNSNSNFDIKSLNASTHVSPDRKSVV